MKALNRYSRSLVAAFLGITAALATVQAQTTVILVRHAEKAEQPANDPPLTVDGQARAKALWDVVKDANVRAIITTQLARTVQTAAPTAQQAGIIPEKVIAGGATHAADVAALVRKHKDETVLVVGHSNTIPAIVAALGAKKPADICDAEYDGLYIVTIAQDGKATLVKSRYGAPSPVNNCAAMR